MTPSATSKQSRIGQPGYHVPANHPLRGRNARTRALTTQTEQDYWSKENQSDYAYDRSRR